MKRKSTKQCRKLKFYHCYCDSPNSVKLSAEKVLEIIINENETKKGEKKTRNEIIDQ